MRKFVMIFFGSVIIFEGMFSQNIQENLFGNADSSLCDTLFPDGMAPSENVFLRHDESNVLFGPEGNNFYWQPAHMVDDPDKQSPRVIQYNNEFVLSYENELGCQLTKTYNIEIDCDILFPIKVLTVLDTSLDENESIKLVPLYGEPYKDWFPANNLNCAGCLEPVAYPAHSTIFQAYLVDEYGCYHTEHFFVNVNFFVPNVFTPNNDGHNDYFEIRGLPEKTKIEIFDKKGNTVYMNDDYGDFVNNYYENWWDGKNVESGTYWYLLERPNMKSIIGNVLVIK